MPIKIPSRFHEPLRAFEQMDRGCRVAITSSIRGAGAVLDPSELISHVAQKSKLPPASIDAIVRMFLSMYRESKPDAEGFVRDVIDAAKVEWPAGDWDSLEGDLKAVLTSDDSLGVTAKAMDVRREHGRVFCNARVLTDIRPVFGPDPSTPPLAGAIIHTLRITYHAAGSHRDFHVALDSNDLHTLRQLVDRALKKESALQSAIGQTSMRFLDSGVE